MKQVRALHFRGCGSVELPDSIFSPAKSLRTLDLSGCWLDELPASISKLKQLRYLDAPYLLCEREPGFLQFLQSLQVLNLSQSSFSSLPESIGNISNLHLINLSGCSNLQNIPASIGNLQNIPASIGNLQNLHYLNLSGCDNLKFLPATVCRIEKLHSLNLSGCRNLETIPANIGVLTNLRSLNLSGCDNFRELPPTIAGLRNLHTLILSNCTKLRKFPYHFCFNFLPKLETLDLQNCCSIGSVLTEIFDTTNLKHLKVLENKSLLSTFIECGGKHINTEELEHQNLMCNELEIIISIERMDHPRDARRVNLSKKQNVRSLILCSGSQKHYLVDEFMTRVLPYLSPHPNLKVLKLVGYMGRSFPYWMIDSKELRLQNLVELTLYGVTAEDHLPSLGHLPSLEVLRLMGMYGVKYLSCKNFTDAQYPSLKELRFMDMHSLTKWTTATLVDDGEQSCEVFMYPRLEKLTITGCPSLMPEPCLPASVVEMVLESSSEAIMSCEWRTGPSSSSSLMPSSSAAASSSPSTPLPKTVLEKLILPMDGKD